MQLIISIFVIATMSIFLNGCIEAQPKKSTSTSTVSNLSLKPSPTKNNADSIAQNTEVNVDGEKITKFTNVDKECRNLVVSTTYEENLAAMTTLATKLTAYKYTGKLSDYLSGTTSEASTLKSQEIKNLLWDYSKNYVWLPMEAEKLYGDTLHERSFSKKVLKNDDKSKMRYAFAESILNEALAKLTKEEKEKHNYQFQIFILNEAGDNAVAIPGGKIYLHTGLVGGRESDFKKLSLIAREKLHDAALFAVTHEISHILQRHETKDIQARIMDSIDIAELSSKLNPANFNMNATESGANIAKILTPILASKQLFTKHHIDQEMQADSCGTILTSRVMDNKPRLKTTLNNFLAKLAKMDNTHKTSENQNKATADPNTNGLVKLSDMLSSPIDQHPTTEDRVKNINNMFALLNIHIDNPILKPATVKPNVKPKNSVKKVIVNQ